jgi:hypothetical protein
MGFQASFSFRFSMGSNGSQWERKGKIWQLLATGAEPISMQPTS